MSTQSRVARSGLAVVVGCAALSPGHLSARPTHLSDSSAGDNATVYPFDKPPLPAWRDDVELWRNPQPIAAGELSLWFDAVAALSDDANASCAYTRLTAPCASCGKRPPMAYAEAATHSLTVPGLEALGAWFDAPVIHDVALWHKERHRPQATPAWTLLAMNGTSPTAHQLQSYAAQMNASAASRARHLAERAGTTPAGDFHPAQVRRMFADRKPSLTLLRDGDAVFLGTPPDPTGANPTRSKLRLTWSIDANRGVLRSFEQRALKRFSPHFGLRFTAYRQRGLFAYEPAANAVVVTHLDYSFHARLALVIPIVSHAKHWYGDFDCARR